MITFKLKTYTDSDSIHDITEAVSGAGLLGGTSYGGYYLGRINKQHSLARARIEAEDKARATRDKLAKVAKKARVKERLAENAAYKKSLKKAKIGGAVALGSGLILGANEAIKCNE